MSTDFSSKEMRRLVQIIGSPFFEGEQAYLRIERVAGLLGIERATAKSYWYDEWKPDPQDVFKAKELCGEPIYEATGHDFSELRKQVTELERQLVRARKDVDRMLGSQARKTNARRRSEADLFSQDDRSLA